jgi:hypothetical protein
MRSDYDGAECGDVGFALEDDDRAQMVGFNVRLPIPVRLTISVDTTDTPHSESRQP